jgi:hypothetical protein
VAINVGLLGELQVEQRLVEMGWHPVRLDTGRMASNTDLLAFDGKQRLSIQVKTTDAGSEHSHAASYFFGYATSYLTNGTPIFNAKKSPLICDIVVGVNYRRDGSRFIIMPVAFAETLCRFACDYWASIPTRAGSKRSSSFPIYLRFSGFANKYRDQDERIARNVATYENAWSILREPIEKLHDQSAWPLID